jgi:FkbM family methyltransferase
LLAVFVTAKQGHQLVASADLSPFGSRTPGRLDRAVLALTRSLPANWLGLRLAILLRRIVTARRGGNPIDTELWGMRLRLHPLGNGCEKNALFTPQMYDVVERNTLAQAIDRRLDQGGVFTFIDIGANVGLYSLFVAARAGARARILAIEPQPGILERLRFNLAANPAARIEVLPIAVADREGAVDLFIDTDDSGGTRIKRLPASRAEGVSVPCRSLLAICADAGIAAIDALKIDVEGAEDLVLAPFLHAAPENLLPRLVVIEDTRGYWRTDVFALLAQHGYTAFARSRHNVALRRG